MMEDGERGLNAAIVAEALEWVGTPYRHQASLKGTACDCLGLIRGIWRSLYGPEPEETGIYSRDWAETSGEERLLDAAGRHFRTCATDDLASGRMILFRWRPNIPAKHAGILIDSSAFIHAYEGNAVMISALVPQWRRRIAGVFAFPVKTGK